LRNLDLTSDIRDRVDVNQLVCLANLESINAHFISEGLSQSERLKKLNIIAISQMKILSSNDRKHIDNISF